MVAQIVTSKVDAYVAVGAPQTALVASKVDAYVMVGPPPRRRRVADMYVLTTKATTVP